jgi:hypothetical protein
MTKIHYTPEFLKAESRLAPRREAPKEIPRWVQIGGCVLILALLVSGWLYDLGIAGWKI